MVAEKKKGGQKRAAKKGRPKEGGQKRAAKRGRPKEGGQKRAAKRGRPKEGGQKRAAKKGRPKKGKRAKDDRYRLSLPLPFFFFCPLTQSLTREIFFLKPLFQAPCEASHPYLSPTNHWPVSDFILFFKIIIFFIGKRKVPSPPATAPFSAFFSGTCFFGDKVAKKTCCVRARRRRRRDRSLTY
jgi:hypothetical protein